jgi:hypothetical protein
VLLPALSALGHNAGRRRIPFAANGSLTLWRPGTAAQQPWVARGRISLMGWADGASALLWAVRPQSPTRKAEPDFRSAIAFYPDCRISSGLGWSARVPTLLLIGARDDISSPPACRQMVEARGPARWRGPWSPGARTISIAPIFRRAIAGAAGRPARTRPSRNRKRMRARCDLARRHRMAGAAIFNLRGSGKNRDL